LFGFNFDTRAEANKSNHWFYLVKRVFIYYYLITKWTFLLLTGEVGFCELGAKGGGGFCKWAPMILY
jgi:hypothetical protein